MKPTIPIIFEPRTYGLLRVSGVAAKKLLQGQLTCNIELITTTNSLLGAHCSPKGRVLVLMRIFYFSQAYYLVMPQVMLTTAMRLLSKYAMFYQAELAVANMPSQQILHCIASHEWRYFNVKLGIPQIYPATSNKFLPHELNLPDLGAISWNKGCYTGQEIIARMEYRGTLKNKLYHLKISNLPLLKRGATIRSNNPQHHGIIVDYVKPYHNCCHALIVSNTNPNTWSKPFQVSLNI